jgi:hypothetical protein
MGVLERIRRWRRVTGYNWRNVLTNFAAVSGILAGFSITFIVLILGGNMRDGDVLPQYKVTWGQVAVLSLGISAALFISAAQFFLLAKEFDKYDIPPCYKKSLEEQHDEIYETWKRFEAESDDRCHQYESSGKNLYNIAVFLIWIGVGSAIWPYNWLIALGVAVVGIVLEFWQTYGQK